MRALPIVNFVTSRLNLPLLLAARTCSDCHLILLIADAVTTTISLVAAGCFAELQVAPFNQILEMVLIMVNIMNRKVLKLID